MRPARKILLNKHTSPATGLWSTEELRQKKDATQNVHRHVREARQDGATGVLAIRGAAASETQMFAGCLIPCVTSQARRKKSGPIEKLDVNAGRKLYTFQPELTTNGGTAG